MVVPALQVADQLKVEIAVEVPKLTPEEPEPMLVNEPKASSVMLEE